MGMFDELMTSLSKEITRVQSRSQEMVKGYALSSQMRTLERRKNGVLTELGRMVFDKYERHLEISDENFKSRTEEIADIDDEMADLQEELEAMQLANDPAASASQKSRAKAGYRPTTGFTCPKCEAPANEDKPFCPSCGCPLGDGKEKHQHKKDDDMLADEEI